MVRRANFVMSRAGHACPGEARARNSATWEKISNPNTETVTGAPPPGNTGLTNPPRWPAMGPSPRNFSANPGYVPWATEIPTFRCPSDPGVGLPGIYSGECPNLCEVCSSENRVLPRVDVS